MIQNPNVEGSDPKKAKANPKASPVGCAAIIDTLLGDNFFSVPRAPIEVRKHWLAMQGYEPRNKLMCIAVQRAFLGGKLRRAEKRSIGFAYVAAHLGNGVPFSKPSAEGLVVA